MINNEWKSGYDTGFAAGWKAAMEQRPNYQNFPPVYYGGTPRSTVSIDPKATVSSMQAGGGTMYASSPTEHFVTGMSVSSSSSDC